MLHSGDTCVSELRVCTSVLKGLKRGDAEQSSRPGEVGDAGDEADLGGSNPSSLSRRVSGGCSGSGEAL